MEKTQEKKEMTPKPARDLGRPEQIRQGVHLHPDVDILDKGQEILLRADMPGAGADGVDVRFENGILSLFGRVQSREVEGDCLLQEYEEGDYYREFLVGDGIDEGKISAEYSDGVLTLHLPKSESAKPRRIEVQRKS